MGKNQGETLGIAATFDGLLASVAAEGAAHTERVRRAVAPLNDAALRRPPAPGVWSCAEVLDHLIVSADGYLLRVEVALRGVPAAPGVTPVRLSLVGGIIEKAAGPSGNAPVPPTMRPLPAPQVRPDVLAVWEARQAHVARLAEAARGRDLNRPCYRNPFIPLLKMNLADFFAITLSHTERHVRQIEDRAARVVG